MVAQEILVSTKPFSRLAPVSLRAARTAACRPAERRPRVPRGRCPTHS